MSRALDFERILNFRDFGDYAVPGRGRLRRGMLYRSGHHARASEADLTWLGTLGLSALIDLRRPEERRNDPSQRPVPFKTLLIEASDECAPEPPFLSLLNDPEISEDRIRSFMGERYRTYPFDPGICHAYRGFFDALATCDGPVLVHCAAGKDRTGVLVALAHHVLGVHRDDLLADYLLTNTHNRFRTRKAEIAENLLRSYGRSVPERLIWMIVSVEAGYLDHAFDEMRQRCGSIDLYLAQLLNVTPAKREQIRHRLII